MNTIREEVEHVRSTLDASPNLASYSRSDIEPAPTPHRVAGRTFKFNCSYWPYTLPCVAAQKAEGFTGYVGLLLQSFVSEGDNFVRHSRTPCNQLKNRLIPYPRMMLQTVNIKVMAVASPPEG